MADETQDWKQQLGPQAEKKIAYVKKMFSPAMKAAMDLGIDPSWVLAQTALESGYGESELAKQYNNLGGVKAKAGEPQAVMPTTEGVQNTPTKEPFKTYESPNQFFEDWTKKLQMPRYSGALSATNVAGYASGLKQGGYFTGGLQPYTTNLQKISKDMDMILKKLPVLDQGIIDSRMGQTGER